MRALAKSVLVRALGSPIKDQGKNAVARVLNDYYGAFGALDPQRAIAYYDVPVVFIGAESIIVATTPREGAAWLAKQFEALKPTGFSRSKLIKLSMKKMSGGLAIASGIDVRYEKSGKQMSRFGITYILRKNAGDWKISVLVSHDPTTALQLN
jgi:ketosteroid isomerase-like protein